VSEWIYFLHPPRTNFAATMTDEEKSVWREHFQRFERLLAEGVIILVGPTLGEANTGIAIFEAPDEAQRQAVDGGGSGGRRRIRPGGAAAVSGLVAPGPAVRSAQP